jgi:hypothetical protein
MSLLGSIGGALKGAVGGFLGSGGNPWAASAGAIAGAQKPNKNKGKGLAKQMAMQRGVAMRPLTNSLVGLPTTNTYSASGAVSTGGYFGGMGATGSWLTPTSTTARPAAGARNPAGGYDANGWPLKANGHPYKRYRSMNPLNGRAARRAIRRIKGARKMLQQIERQLPKQRSHTTRSRAK